VSRRTVLLILFITFLRSSPEAKYLSILLERGRWTIDVTLMMLMCPFWVGKLADLNSPCPLRFPPSEAQTKVGGTMPHIMEPPEGTTANDARGADYPIPAPRTEI
jgi:hypothetical protein